MSCESQVEIHKTSELRSWNSMELEKHETSQLGSEKEDAIKNKASVSFLDQVISPNGQINMQIYSRSRENIPKFSLHRSALTMAADPRFSYTKKSHEIVEQPSLKVYPMKRYASQMTSLAIEQLFTGQVTKKVLVVDDEIFLLEFLREILENLGLEVYTASSPERAFELSTTLCNLNKKIDLVYMDFNMPGMNGAECIKILKSPPHKRSMEHAWFTALSAQDDKMVRDQFRGVGVSEFISKPYSFEQIVQHLAQRQLISFDNA